MVETASGLTASANHTITVSNVPPSDVSIIREGSLVVGEKSTFKGSAFDPGADELTYRWEFGDGATAEGQIVTHTFQAEGGFTVTLTVTDDDGGVGATEMVLTTLAPPPPPISETVSMGEVSSSPENPKEGDAVSFSVTLLYESVGEDEPVPGALRFYIDDPDGTYDPFWETEITLTPGGNEFTTPRWVSEPGSHIATFVAEFEGGAAVFKDSLDFEVQEKGMDLLPLLVVLFGVFGLIVYLLLTKTKVVTKKGEEKDGDREEKDFCKEHPEVVEQEEQACWDAQLALSDALGDVRDQFNDAKPRWQEYSRTVGRLLAEWDTIVALIAHWTGAEKELYETAEKVQRVAGFVQNASSKAVKAFKEGGEAALKEVGEDFAKDIASSIAGEVSETVGKLLDLEDWAIREVGTGIARGLTGVDPRRNASKMRAKSELICAQLQSWVSSSRAREFRQPPDPLHSCIEEMQRMLDAIERAEKDFEDAVKGFRCIECEIPEELLKLMDQLTRQLNDFIKAFGDMIDQVEQRLNQALTLYNRKDVYEGPLEHLSKSRRHSTYIKKYLRDSAERKKELGIG